jgi:protein phosphatase
VGNALDGPGAPYVILEGTPTGPQSSPGHRTGRGVAEPGHVGISFVRVPYDVEAEVEVALALEMPGAEAYALELREQRYRGSAVTTA